MFSFLKKQNVGLGDRANRQVSPSWNYVGNLKAMFPGNGI